MAKIARKGIRRRSDPDLTPDDPACLSADFMRSLDPNATINSTLRNIARNAAGISGEEACLIHLLNRRRNLLELALRHKAGKGFAQAFRPGEGIPGSALRGERCVVEPDLSRNSSGPWKEGARKEGIVSAICLPLRGRKTVLGTLTVLARNPG
ncbi:MAG: GAF domain-containing protein, partial [Chloroflexi bacterium]